MNGHRLLRAPSHHPKIRLGCALAVAVLAAAGCAQSPSKPGPKPGTQPAVTPHTAQKNATPPSGSTNTRQQAGKSASRAQKPAPAPVVRKHAPLEYVVKRGDTLWDIAGYFLRDPWLWPEIWHANPHIANPHLIYPGDTLYLSYVNGRPQIRLRPGTLRLEPKVRRQPLASAISTIPMSAIRPFLHGPRVVESDTLKNAGYIVAFANNQLLGSQGATAYATHLGKKPQQMYQVVHQGHAYHDPATGKILGYEAIPTARAELDSPGRNGEAATLTLAKSYQETSLGDRLLPTQSTSLRTSFTPHAPKADVRGQIISVFHGVAEIGRYQVVTLDRGTSSGLNAGSVLGIYQAGRKVPDPYGQGHAASVQLPPIKAGVLMVFKTSRHLSYALIMNATRSIHVLDTVHKIQDGT